MKSRSLSIGIYSARTRMCNTLFFRLVFLFFLHFRDSLIANCKKALYGFLNISDIGVRTPDLDNCTCRFEYELYLHWSTRHVINLWNMCKHKYLQWLPRGVCHAFWVWCPLSLSTTRFEQHFENDECIIRYVAFVSLVSCFTFSYKYLTWKQVLQQTYCTCHYIQHSFSLRND